MIEYLIAICLLLLTLGHGILIHGCMTWTKERRATTAGLEDKLATLATLIDEGLDMMSEVTGDVPAPPPMGGQSMDVRAMLTNAFISRLTATPEHGSTQTEQEDRKIQQGDTTQTQTQTDD
jgi:hypothetical protein